MALEAWVFNYALISLLIASPLSFLSLQFLSAPYGKHNGPGWGPLLYPPFAWFVMESPTLWLSLLIFPYGRNRIGLRSLVLYSPFLSHYFHRSLFYPLRLHLRYRKISLVTADGNSGFGETASGKTAFDNTALVENRRRKGVFDNTAFGDTASGKTAFEDTDDAFGKTAIENTALVENRRREEVFEDTAFENTDDVFEKTDFDNTVDRKTAFDNTADRKTALDATVFDNIADRKTAFENTAERKTAGGETAYWESDGLAHRKTGAFENTADRKTAFVNTADRKTAFESTADRELDGLKISDGKTSDQKTASGFPASIALMAFSYNIWNTYLQARWVSHYADLEADEWFWWRFCLGMAVFVTGMAVNIWSDSVLLGLKSGNGKYRVPKGGLFELVSCPNYLGEVVEWFGWALMTWSWVGFGFFLFTCSNLVPRACSNHKWYLDKFGEDYPKNRKAVIPFLY